MHIASFESSFWKSCELGAKVGRTAELIEAEAYICQLKPYMSGFTRYLVTTQHGPQSNPELENCKEVMNPVPLFQRLSSRLKNRYSGHPFRLFTGTLKGFFLLHLVHSHFYTTAITWGPSMLPTFEVMYDRVIVDRWYRRGRGVQVGDVVTFDSVHEVGERVIKRVIGLEGDYVLRDTPGSESNMMIQVGWYLYIELFSITNER
jgi:hypothetical protein